MELVRISVEAVVGYSPASFLSVNLSSAAGLGAAFGADLPDGTSISWTVDPLRVAGGSLAARMEMGCLVA